MKQGIERVLALKNRTINNLMKELEQAEQQYSYNFQSHLFHVHEIIGKIIFFILYVNVVRRSDNILIKLNVYEVLMYFLFCLHHNPELCNQKACEKRSLSTTIK